MKKALILASFFSLAAATFAQGSTGGSLNFKTLGILKADGSGTYNVPIYQNSGTIFGMPGGNPKVGAGSLPGGATLGLFLPNSNTPFFTSVLGTTTAQSPYAVSPASQAVIVPGSAPGQTVPLIIRVWQGTSFDSARVNFGTQWGEWSFTTRPLGGDPGNGALIITPPTLTNWGPEDGSGYELSLIPEPSSIGLGVLGLSGLALARRRKQEDHSPRL